MGLERRVAYTFSTVRRATESLFNGLASILRPI